jgi:hypothetical protein
MSFLHNSAIRVRVVLCILVALASPSLSSAQTVTAPASRDNVATSGEFFSSAFQDSANMKELSDIGYFAYGVDPPSAGLSNISFANSVFTATATNTQPNIYLLETGNTNAVPYGRRGDVHAIDGSRYRTLALRMRLPGAQGVRASDGQIIWSAKTIYDSATSAAGSFFVYGGWQVYLIDIPTLGTALGTPWQGSIGSLRLNPTTTAGQKMEIDWARLVSNDTVGFRTITWSGSGAVDIYLDTDTVESNGTLGLIAKNATSLSKGVSGGSFQFQPGALPTGDYHVAIRASGTANALRYSSGYYHVAGVPTLKFTSPSPEGSSDDFATTQLGNAWDMNSVADVDATANVTGLRIENRVLETTAGVNLGAQRVLAGSNTAGSMDPILYLLAPWKRPAGATIDTSRYRLLTLDLGVAGARNINGGSVLRLGWRQKGDSENISHDTIINHRAGANSLETFTIDMKKLPLEPGAGSPSHSGWTGAVELFRVDPHEFTPAREFWVRRVRLAALERAGSSYRIAWQYDAQGSDATMSLYYDSDGRGFDGTRIVDGVNPAAGSYSFNSSGFVPGQDYYIYARLADSTGRVISQTYADVPITGGGTSPAPAPAPAPTGSNPIMSLDLPGPNAVVQQPFALGGWAADLGSTTGPGVDVVHVWAYPNPGSGAAPSFVGAAPNNGARPDVAAYLGATRFTNSGFGLLVAGLAPGKYQLVAFAHSTVTGTFNQTRAAVVTVVGTPPRMSIDLPGNNSAVGTSFMVAGWAIDQNARTGPGVDAIHVWAYPNPGSGAAPRFVAATTTAASRPDVAAIFGANALRSGYNLIGTLPPGVYDLVVYAHSTATNTFNNAQVARITVR